MSESYELIIVLAFFGFCALAAILLIPVYRFLKREERISSSWTAEALAREADRMDRQSMDETAEDAATPGDEAEAELPPPAASGTTHPQS
jgi:hypothetical protein